MKLRRFRWLLASLLLAGPAAAAGAPNIVLVIGDDHGWPYASFMGHPTVQTPILDVLAANGVLGVIETEEQSIDGEIEALIEAREKARAARDWSEADRIRDQLLEQGITLEDTPDGTLWRRD